MSVGIFICILHLYLSYLILSQKSIQGIILSCNQKKKTNSKTKIWGGGIYMKYYVTEQRKKNKNKQPISLRNKIKQTL